MNPDNNINNNGLNQNGVNPQSNNMQSNNQFNQFNNFQNMNYNQNLMNNNMYQGQPNMYVNNQQNPNDNNPNKSNKKISIIVVLALLALIIVIVVIFVLNTNNKSEGLDNNLSPENNVIPNNDGKEEGNNNDIQPEEKLDKMQFPRMTKVFSVPESCIRRANRTIVATTDNKAYLLTVFVGDKGDHSGKPEDILTASTETYERDIIKYLHSDIKGELKADTTERVTVSGYEAVKFTGSTINITNDANKIYGYTMIIDNRPAMFMGILVSEEQGDEDLNAMKKLVDLMVNTIQE
jgi:hypothetical protein